MISLPQPQSYSICHLFLDGVIRTQWSPRNVMPVKILQWECMRANKCNGIIKLIIQRRSHVSHKIFHSISQKPHLACRIRAIAGRQWRNISAITLVFAFNVFCNVFWVALATCFAFVPVITQKNPNFSLVAKLTLQRVYSKGKRSNLAGNLTALRPNYSAPSNCAHQKKQPNFSKSQ